MECFPNAGNRFCAGHRFSPPADISALTCVFECGMITVLGRIFPAPFSSDPQYPVPGALTGPAHTENMAFGPRGPKASGRHPGRPLQILLFWHGHEMTPDIRRGSFQFLGFNHWVTSLSAGSTGLFWFGWNPFRSIHVLQLTVCDWHLCKTEDIESPAGRCTYHIWYHLFSYHQSTTP